MKKIIKGLPLLFVSVLILVLSMTVSALAAYDTNTDRYILRTAGNKMIFDTQLAELARQMSSDAYGITNTNIDKWSTMKSEQFITGSLGVHNWSETFDPQALSPKEIIRLINMLEIVPDEIIDIFGLDPDEVSIYGMEAVLQRVLPTTPLDVLHRLIPDSWKPTSDNFTYGVKTFNGNGRTSNILVISFKGSESLGSLESYGKPELYIDWFLTNGDFWSGGNGYHSGFYRTADSAYNSCLNRSLGFNGMTFNQFFTEAAKPDSNYYVMVTGHSMGGAVANI